MPVRETVTIDFDGDAAGFIAAAEAVKAELESVQRAAGGTTARPPQAKAQAKAEIEEEEQTRLNAQLQSQSRIAAAQAAINAKDFEQRRMLLAGEFNSRRQLLEEEFNSYREQNRANSRDRLRLTQQENAERLRFFRDEVQEIRQLQRQQLKEYRDQQTQNIDQELKLRKDLSRKVKEQERKDRLELLNLEIQSIDIENQRALRAIEARVREEARFREQQDREVLSQEELDRQHAIALEEDRRREELAKREAQFLKDREQREARQAIADKDRADRLARQNAIDKQFAQDREQREARQAQADKDRADRLARQEALDKQFAQDRQEREARQAQADKDRADRLARQNAIDKQFAQDREQREARQAQADKDRADRLARQEALDKQFAQDRQEREARQAQADKDRADRLARQNAIDKQFAQDREQREARQAQADKDRTDRLTRQEAIDKQIAQDRQERERRQAIADQDRLDRLARNERIDARIAQLDAERGNRVGGDFLARSTQAYARLTQSLGQIYTRLLLILAVTGLISAAFAAWPTLISLTGVAIAGFLAVSTTRFIREQRELALTTRQTREELELARVVTAQYGATANETARALDQADRVFQNISQRAEGFGLQTLGFDIEQLEREGRDTLGILAELQTALSAFGEVQQVNIIRRIFGDDAEEVLRLLTEVDIASSLQRALQTQALIGPQDERQLLQLGQTIENVLESVRSNFRAFVADNAASIESIANTIADRLPYLFAQLQDYFGPRIEALARNLPTLVDQAANAINEHIIPAFDQLIFRLRQAGNLFDRVRQTFDLNARQIVDWTAALVALLTTMALLTPVLRGLSVLLRGGAALAASLRALIPLLSALRGAGSVAGGAAAGGAIGSILGPIGAAAGSVAGAAVLGVGTYYATSAALNQLDEALSDNNETLRERQDILNELIRLEEEERKAIERAERLSSGLFERPGEINLVEQQRILKVQEEIAEQKEKLAELDRIIAYQNDIGAIAEASRNEARKLAIEDELKAREERNKKIQEELELQRQEKERQAELAQISRENSQAIEYQSNRLLEQNRILQERVRNFPSFAELFSLTDPNRGLRAQLEAEQRATIPFRIDRHDFDLIEENIRISQRLISNNIAEEYKNALNRIIEEGQERLKGSRFFLQFDIDAMINQFDEALRLNPLRIPFVTSDLLGDIRDQLADFREEIVLLQDPLEQFLNSLSHQERFTLRERLAEITPEGFLDRYNQAEEELAEQRQRQLQLTSQIENAFEGLNRTLARSLLGLNSFQEGLRNFLFNLAENITTDLLNQATSSLRENLISSLAGNAVEAGAQTTTVKVLADIVQQGAGKATTPTQRTAPVIEINQTVVGSSPNTVRQSSRVGARQGLQEALGTAGGRELLRQAIEEEEE